MQNFNRLTVTATAAALAIGVLGCGGSRHQEKKAQNAQSPVRVEKVPLNKELSPANQARQIQNVLNAGKEITGATVEFGQIMHDASGAIDIENPIKLGSGVYGYYEYGRRLKVSTLKYAGKLLQAAPRFKGPSLAGPHVGEAQANLAAVYAEFPLADGETARYYAISANQPPGRYYGEHTIVAGAASSDNSCVPHEGCG